jgi:hypothetical protein
MVTTRMALLVLLLVVGCTETTAPTVDCRGTLEVTIQVHRLGADTTVACVFPVDTTTTPLPPPPHHRHHHHHRGPR